MRGLRDMSSDPSAPGSDNADAPEKDGVSDERVRFIAAKWGIPEAEAKRMLQNREIATDGGVDQDDTAGPFRVMASIDVSRTEADRLSRNIDDPYRLVWEGPSSGWIVYDEALDNEREIVTDGGYVACVKCNRHYDRSEHDGCPHCENADLTEFATDGGLDFEGLNAIERQADALEELTEQLRIQNAILMEQVRTLDFRIPELREHAPQEPVTPRSGRSVAGWVEDAALDLDERVDLDAVDRASEGSE